MPKPRPKVPPKPKNLNRVPPAIARAASDPSAVKNIKSIKTPSQDDIRKDNESANNACIKHTHASLPNWRQNHFGSSVEDKLTQGLQNHAQMPSICSTITRNVHPCSQVL